MSGWIKLHRQITDNDIWHEEPFTKGQAWIDILLMVNHKEGKFLLGGKMITVEAGSRVTSIRKLCKRWMWSNTKVKSFLNLLAREGMLTHESDSKKTVLTVTNWGLYQNGDGEKRHGNVTETPPKHTNKNKKNEKNEKNKEEDRVPYEKIKDLYNELCTKLPKVQSISERRRKHLRARWKQLGGIETFQDAFTKANRSPFLCGQNDRGWKADFDWLIKNEDNITKVLEGKYLDKGGGGTRPRPR